ncbi:MAG: phosphopantetheine-binding protein, partial [Verrucomicrobiaceae bacterium]|nr:phosphopantetheine-binding protein [Verrucomicrobiaceae bacterium]
PSDAVLRQIYADEIELKSLGADSFDRLELSMMLEEKFGIKEIPVADNERWQTVGDVIRFVQHRGAGASGVDGSAAQGSGHENSGDSSDQSKIENRSASGGSTIP